MIKVFLFLFLQKKKSLPYLATRSTLQNTGYCVRGRPWRSVRRAIGRRMMPVAM